MHSNDADKQDDYASEQQDTALRTYAQKQKQCSDPRARDRVLFILLFFIFSIPS